MSKERSARSTLTAGNVIPALLIAALAGATIYGATLPWGTGKVLFISHTVDGFDLDGEITLGIGVALIAGALAYLALRFGGVLYALYSLAGGVGILGVVAWQYTKLEDVILKLGPFTLQITPEVSMEEGMLITILSGAGITMISLWMLILAYLNRSRSV